MTYVNPLFANNSSVTGTVNFNCEKFALPIVGGTKNDIEIIGTIAADNVKLGSSGLLGQLMIAAGDKFGGEVITMHPTKFTLQQGFLRYDNMQIDVGQKPFIFKGAVGLDETLNMMVTLPYGGGVTVPLRGTVSKPKPDLGKLFENIAKKQLEGELKKSLEGLFKK